MNFGENMKKKLTILFAALLVVVTAAVVIGGCTENLKQDAIATEFSDVVASNGGMAVVYGNYLYFVNGYAGETASNTFGEVVKGAVCRVALTNGVPSGEAQVIVPKNVYGTDKTYGGIYIVDDYIYYATTSTELDGDGNPKTSQSVIMRTKVDGTDTSVIAEFSDHTVVFKVVEGKLVYIRNSAIFSVDINNSKFPETTVAENILTDYIFGEEYLFFMNYAEDSTTDYIVKVYPLGGGEVKTILDAEKLGSPDTNYTFALLSAIDEGENIRLFYSKTDDGVNTPETGVYSYLYSKDDFAFDKTKEARYTLNSTGTTNLAYTDFYKAGDYYLGLSSGKLDAFNADGTRVPGSDGIESLNISGTVTVFDVETTSDAVYLWYLKDSVYYRIRILAKEGEGYKFVEDNAYKIFSASCDSSYLAPEKIGSVVYYFNSDISNNAYYYVIPEETTSETDTAKGKILGLITEADIVAAF